MVCDEIARRLPSKAAQSVEEPCRRFEGPICSRQSGVKILTSGPFSFSGRIYIQRQTRPHLIRLREDAGGPHLSRSCL